MLSIHVKHKNERLKSVEVLELPDPALLEFLGGPPERELCLLQVDQYACQT